MRTVVGVPTMESAADEVSPLSSKKVDRPLRVPRPSPKADAAAPPSSSLKKGSLEKSSLKKSERDDDIDDLDDWTLSEPAPPDDRPTLRVLTPARPPRMPDAPIPFPDTPEVPHVETGSSVPTVPAPAFSTPTMPVIPVPGPPPTPVPISDLSPMTVSLSASAMKTLVGVGPGSNPSAETPLHHEPMVTGTPGRTSGTSRTDATVRSILRMREGLLSRLPQLSQIEPARWLEPAFVRWPALRRAHENKPRFVLPALIGMALLVWLLGIGLFIKGTVALARRIASSDERSASADRAARGATSASGAAGLAGNTAAASASVEEPAPAAAPCTVVGSPKSIAAQAQLVSGVEATAGLRGIGLGFARAPKEAVTLLLDPSALTVDSIRAYNALEPIRRTTPILTAAPGPRAPNTKADRITVAIATDAHDGVIEGRRTSGGASPIDLGVAAGYLVWAHHDSNFKTNPLWQLDGDSPVEALRAVPLEPAESGYALAFRRGGAIWTGVIDHGTGDKGYIARGELSEVRGLGSQVGSPSIAVSGETQMVIWADRASSNDAWSLRYLLRRHGGDVAEPAKSFEVPPGGLGAPYMSPAVTALGGGRFLVVWTEGPVSGHQVRAQTLGADGRSQGSPLTISADGANAGQGQAAVLADGRGAVAYLVGTNNGWELVATSISCP